MDDQPSDLDPQDAGTPRWVKVFAAITLVLVVLVVVLAFFGGGGHGPGRHSALTGTAQPR